MRRRKGIQYIALRDGSRPVDVYVGMRVKNRRVLVGMGQDELGERIGLTFQQIQKYERGKSRISAGKLWEISGILGVPVKWFFEGADKPNVQAEYTQEERKKLKLARAFNACPKETQDHLLALFKAVAGMKGGA